MDRCTVVLMLWHFHKEMDVVGSIRQHSDIYIRKEWMLLRPGEERKKKKRWERNSMHSGYHPPSSLMLLDSHFAPPAVVQRWYMKYFLYTICSCSQQKEARL